MRIPTDGWLTYQKDSQHAAHILPLNDLIKHRTKRPCICHPRFSFKKCNGPDDIATILIHNSLDGREQREV